jgi:hypothetical protein
VKYGGICGHFPLSFRFSEERDERHDDTHDDNGWCTFGILLRRQNEKFLKVRGTSRLIRKSKRSRAKSSTKTHDPNQSTGESAIVCMQRQFIGWYFEALLYDL